MINFCRQTPDNKKVHEFELHRTKLLSFFAGYWHHFNPRHRLLSHVGLYNFEFELAFGTMALFKYVKCSSKSAHGLDSGPAGIWIDLQIFADLIKSLPDIR